MVRSYLLCADSIFHRIASSATDLARKFGIDGYMCPDMEWNPWSPAGPGQHGYMQTGFGQSDNLYEVAEVQHVFVGVGSPKKYIYCGKYNIHRVDRLDPTEWHALSQQVCLSFCGYVICHIYASLTQFGAVPRSNTIGRRRLGTKNGEVGKIEGILSQYNDGTLRAPCQLLQCVEFDMEFWGALVRAKNEIEGQLPQSTSSTKRKREDNDDNDAISVTQPSTSKKSYARRKSTMF